MRDAFERLFQQVWGHRLCALSIVKNPINLFRNQNYLASHRTDILYCLVIEQSICTWKLKIVLTDYAHH